MINCESELMRYSSLAYYSKVQNNANTKKTLEIEQHFYTNKI